jgi:hypothetical protein
MKNYILCYKEEIVMKKGVFTMMMGLCVGALFVNAPPSTAADTAQQEVIAGSIGGAQGPMDDIVIDPEYFDCSVPAGQVFVHATDPGPVSKSAHNFKALSYRSQKLL